MEQPDQNCQVEHSIWTAPKDGESIFQTWRPKKEVEHPTKIIANLLASASKN